MIDQAPRRAGGEEPSQLARDFDRLWANARVEVAAIVRDYIKLTRMKLQANAKHTKQAVACLAVAALFGAIGAGELIYGLVGWAVADTPQIHEQALVTLISAVVCLVLAGIGALAAAAAIKQLYPLKKLVEPPLAPMPLSAPPLRQGMAHL